MDTSFDDNVTVADSSGAAVGGTLTVPASGGVATFTGLSEDQATFGTTLLASSTDLNPATTSSFSVTPAAATQLVVEGPFGNVLPNAPFGTTVFAEDLYGNLVPSAGGDITLSLSPNPSGLGGTLTAPLVLGMAGFPDLKIGQAGSGYTIEASGAGLPQASSAAFDVAGDQLVVTVQPPGSVSTGLPGFGLTVAAETVSGSVDASFPMTSNVSVTLIDLTGTGAMLGGTQSEAPVGGVAAFSGLTLDQPGPYLLSVTASGADSATTDSVTVVGPVDLSQSTIAVSAPAVATGGTATVTLTARDAAGNQEPAGGLTVAFKANGSAGGSFGPVADNNNGTYTATFTAGATPGSATITATIGGPGNTVTTPPPVLVVVGPVSPALSTITASPSTLAPRGKATLTLTALDANGNQELGGGLKVKFKLSGSAGGKIGPATDHKNGTYTATFTAGAALGSDTVGATIGSPPQAVTGTATVTVTPTGHSVMTQDAALMAVLADSGRGTAAAGSKKSLSAADLWRLYGA